MERTRLVHVAIALAVVGLILSIWLQSGRTAEREGLGYDGEQYAEMVESALYRGGDNARMRPLVLLLNQLVYDFIVPDVIRTFQVMNFIYAGLLALILCGILDTYGVSPVHKLVFALNVFATIAITKMFAFYPVLIDLGAYLFVALAVYAILRWHRLAVVACTVLAVLAREFGLAVVLFGLHRDLRQRTPLFKIAATYLPAVVTFVALRQWVLATSFRSRPLGQMQGGLIVWSDVPSNLLTLANPAVLLFFAYFALTVFGGISVLLFVRALRGRLGIGAEGEWITFSAVVGGLAFIGNADLWRYLAYGLPAIAVLYAKSLSSQDWRIIAPWSGLITVVTQQPWITMTDLTYFEDWFPLYLAQFGIPDDPSPQFWATWAVRMTLVACLALLVWWAQRPRRIPGSAGADMSELAV